MSSLTFPNPATKELYYKEYDRCLRQWNVDTETFYIETAFGKTHIIACGPKDAIPVVLIHGMTVSSTMWFANAPVWSKKYRVYAIDTIGDFGRSECNRPLSSNADINTWLNEVLDALNIDKFFLIGHSMGGWIALQYSLQSERVRKLVLLAPVMSFCSLNWRFPLKLLPAMTLKNNFFIRSLYKWMFAKGNTPNPTLFNQFLMGYKHGKIQLRVAPNVFPEAELKKLLPETLLMIGENEVIYSSITKAVKNASLSPKITAKLIPNSSHCLPAEQYEIVNQFVIDFLGQ